MTEAAAQYLDWIAERLVRVYGESPDTDFVAAARGHAQSLRLRIKPTPSALDHEAGARPGVIAEVFSGINYEHVQQAIVEGLAFRANGDVWRCNFQGARMPGGQAVFASGLLDLASAAINVVAEIKRQRAATPADRIAEWCPVCGKVGVSCDWIECPQDRPRQRAATPHYDALRAVARAAKVYLDADGSVGGAAEIRRSLEAHKLLREALAALPEGWDR